MTTTALFWTSYILLWLLTLCLACAVYVLCWYSGNLLLNQKTGRVTQGPKEGKRLKRQSANQLDGAELGIGGRSEFPQLVVFMTTTCGPCHMARSALGVVAQEFADVVEFVLVCRGSRDDVVEFTKDLPEVVRTIHDPKWTLGFKLRVSSTPFAVLIGEDRAVLAKGMPGSVEHFQQMLTFVPELEMRRLFIADENGGGESFYDAPMSSKVNL